MRSSDLAGWQGVDRSTITVQLRRLEERDLVVRTPDPDDGRVVLLTASAAGDRVMAAVTDHGARALQSLMTGLERGRPTPVRVPVRQVHRGHGPRPSPALSG